ncbi:DUF5683 domain-containing protein [Aggregatimonas sangjinii]|uniref:DUF5683 domain-containing protein n=1 Tax=Aggregatimonas sangjinii TaxID=2583587 RepID=UPI001F283903|nr:DUF5683 domain-containing protein [Aggregatimonas sangjinii]
MAKHLIVLFFVLASACCVKAQEEKTEEQPEDSLGVNLKEQGIVVQDSIFKKKKVINPLAPSKAAFLSAIFPGMGQVYNKRYWKVPIVYAAIGTGIYVYDLNNEQYNRYRDAFKRRQAGFNDDEFWDFQTPDDGNIPDEPFVPNTALEDAQERFQRDRDLALVVTIILYALNIVDANVDAHLKQFNIDDDLSIDWHPYLNVDPIMTTPNYGMAVVVRF